MAPVALIAVAVEVECENDKAVEFFEMPPRLWISNTQPLQACSVPNSNLKFHQHCFQNVRSRPI